jgi:hypothetical protein
MVATVPLAQVVLYAGLKLHGSACIRSKKNNSAKHIHSKKN